MTTREPYSFKNWKEMYDTIKSGTDLYCAELSSYAFLYNEDGAICTYHIGLQSAKKLAIDSENSGEPGYWGRSLAQEELFMMTILLTGKHSMRHI